MALSHAYENGCGKEDRKTVEAQPRGKMEIELSCDFVKTEGRE